MRQDLREQKERQESKVSKAIRVKVVKLANQVLTVMLVEQAIEAPQASLVEMDCRVTRATTASLVFM